MLPRLCSIFSHPVLRTAVGDQGVKTHRIADGLATWGWIDGEYSNAIHADFRNDPSILNKNKIEGTFTHLALDPLPAPAGPNVCFSVEHNEEPDSVEDDISDYQSVFSNPISDQKYTVGNRQYTVSGLDDDHGGVFADRIAANRWSLPIWL